MQNADLVGKTVGQYRILEEIGRGGMAVVYRAWQPTLKRHVALKVLPEYFRHDPEFLERFWREARAAAQLSHPNIIRIYDTGSADGVHFIAMEYLEGGSLVDRLRAGPMGEDAIQRVIEEVGSALDYAHGQGLIHRDVKPANILLTADGRAKVTDFGIVHAAHGTRLTQTGSILGTPEYMSPEQAAGDAVDPRTDLYALGVVLYQALVGRVPFQGTTPHAVIHGVIYTPPPPPREINPRLSPPVESVLLKALAKDPAQRFQRGAAMADALRRARRGEGVVVPKRARIPPVVVALAVATVLMVALAVLLWLRSSSPGKDTPTATALVLATQTLLATADPGSTPDDGHGRPATLTAAAAGVFKPEHLTSTAEVAVQLTTGARAAKTETAAAVATQTAGAASARLTEEAEDADARATREAMEATRTAVAATQTVQAQPTRTPSPSPVPPTRTSPPPPTEARKPEPVGLVFASERDGNRDIYVMNGDGSGVTRVTNHGAEDRFPALSPDRRRVAFMSKRDGNWEIYVQSLDGSGLARLTNNGAIDRYPSWSPNGARIAFVSDRDGNQEVYVMRPDGSEQVRLTNNGADDRAPAWSPGGQRIAFASQRSGNLDIWVIQANGAGATQLTYQPSKDSLPVWSPDGSRIAYVCDPNGDNDICVMNADGSGQWNLTNSPSGEADPTWSPDSSLVVFSTNRDGNREVYSINVGTGATTNLSRHPAYDGQPSWASR